MTKSKLKHSVARAVSVGKYSTLEDASRQVDLLMLGNGDLCVNIVQDGRNAFGGKGV